MTASYHHSTHTGDNVYPQGNVANEVLDHLIRRKSIPHSSAVTNLVVQSAVLALGLCATVMVILSRKSGRHDLQNSKEELDHEYDGILDSEQTWQTSP